MNIIEATKKAMNEGKGIILPEMKKSLYLLPTNTEECFFVIPIGYRAGDSKRPAVRWNPKANDMLREDWELYPTA